MPKGAKSNLQIIPWQDPQTVKGAFWASGHGHQLESSFGMTKNAKTTVKVVQSSQGKTIPQKTQSDTHQTILMDSGHGFGGAPTIEKHPKPQHRQQQKN
jgi:hypothetical protein